MRALIDASGWPEALSYYRMFPHETSLTAAMDFPIGEVTAVDGISLERVLEEMARAGENDEREILIVAHGTVAAGNPGGLSMPLARGCEVDAMRDEVRAVTQAATALSQAAVDPLGWTRFIEDASERRRILASATPEQGPELLRQWIEARAQSLGMEPDRLRELIDKRDAVVRCGFDRVEIRACNLGAFPDAMEALQAFFGTARLVAPKITTLYGKVHLRIIEDFNQYQEWIQSRGGPGLGDAFGEAAGAFGRCFPEAFCLRIKETSAESYSFELDAAALSEQAVQSWVENYVMRGSGYAGHGALWVGAFWTFGQPGLPQPYVLPGEADYRTLIASYPP